MKKEPLDILLIFFSLVLVSVLIPTIIMDSVKLADLKVVDRFIVVLKCALAITALKTYFKEASSKDQTQRLQLKKEAYEKVDTVIKEYSDKRPMVKDEQWQEGFINGYVIGRELNEKPA